MPKKNIIWVAAILVSAAAAAWIARGGSQPPGRINAPSPDALDKAVEKIESSYYLPVDRKRLFCGAVRGMVGQLDEFCSYIPPEKVLSFERRMSGKAQGLGLRVKVTEGWFRWCDATALHREHRGFRRRIEITNVFFDSPAARAEVRPGQWLVSIDDKPTANMTIEQVREELAVPAGTSIELVIDTLPYRLDSAGADDLSRSNVPSPRPAIPIRTIDSYRTVTLASARFRIESVTGLYRRHTGRWVWMLDDDRKIAYVRIREFVNDTAESLRKSLRGLHGLKGLVLDLRGNPGGKGTAAIGVADMFLREGLIVRMVDRAGEVQEHRAHAEGTFHRMPMVVLVDAGTASGAELVAGALRANYRAVIVGGRTRGKGCVQTMVDLGELGMVNLTTAQFVFDDSGTITRTGDSDTWGVEPHLRVQIPLSHAEALRRLRALARTPAGKWAQTQPTTTPGETVVKIAADLLALDTQLARAGMLLRTPDKVEAILADAARKDRLERRRATATQPSAARRRNHGRQP